MTHRLLRARTGATALAAIVLLVGCTPAGGGSSLEPSASPSASDTPVPAPPGTPDPCTLLTAAFIEEVSGFPMLDGARDTSLSGSGRSVCDWDPKSTQRNVPRIQVEVNWGFNDATAHRALAEELFGEVKDIEIEGATDAFAYPGYRTEAMQVGEYFVKVSYTHPNRTDAGKITTQLATEVAKNLG